MKRFRISGFLRTGELKGKVEKILQVTRKDVHWFPLIE